MAIFIAASVVLALGLVPVAALAEVREEAIEVMAVGEDLPVPEYPTAEKPLRQQAEIGLVDTESSDYEALEDDFPETDVESDEQSTGLIAEDAKASSDLSDFLIEAAVEGAVEIDGVAHVIEGHEYDVRMTFAERPDLRFADDDLTLQLPSCLAVSGEQPWLSRPVTVRRLGDCGRREELELDGVDLAIEDGTLRLAWADADASALEQPRSLDDVEFDVVVRGSFLPGTEELAVGGAELPVRVELAEQATVEETNLVGDGDDGELPDGQQLSDDPEQDVHGAGIVDEPLTVDGDASAAALDEGTGAGEAAEDPESVLVEATRREYVYVDDQVRVVATLADLGAVPDDAELRVRQVRPGEPGGGAEAYLDAMNDATGGRPHTERNTLLYDVAFVLGGEEIEPAEGSVSVSFAFRRGQLGDGLGATRPGDVEVTHIVEEGGELVPEPVEASVSPARGLAAFDAESFSVYAFSYTVDFELDGLEYTLPGEGSVMLSRLFAALGVREDVGRVESVEFSSPELVSVSRSLVGGDWVLVSLKPFDTQEELTVAMQTGLRYTISVTDAQIMIVAQPQAATVTDGQVAIFSVAATGIGLTYRWQTKLVGSDTWQNTNLGGNRTRTLGFATRLDHDGRSYRCVVSGSGGLSITSCEAKLKVIPKPVVTSSPASVTKTSGQTATFSVSATGTGLTYQWQTMLPGSGKWQNTNFGGNRTRTLSFMAQLTHNGRKYRCIVTDANGVSVPSGAATLTVRTSIAISTHPPSTVSMTEGQAVVIGVVATGTGLTYQWQTLTVGGSGWVNTGFEGNRTRALTINGSTSYDGRKYRCRVTDGGGSTVTSDVTMLTVVAKPAITSQPAGVTRAPGQAASFSVTATGTGLTYQWQTQLVGSAAWQSTNLGGSRTRTLSFTAQPAHNGRRYRCVVTDANGCPVTSREATLTVGTAPNITSQPSSITRDVGQTATFSVTATGTGLTYQWQTQLVGSAAWQSTNLGGSRTRTLSFTAQPAHSGRRYRCVVTGANGISGTSGAATLTVVAGPTIDSGPSSRKACAGQTASFYVGASGTGLTYQWQTQLVGSGTWQSTNLGGSRTSQLSFTAQSAHSGRRYRCRVTDAQGVTVTSGAATLTVAPTRRLAYGQHSLSVDAQYFRQRLSFVPRGTGTYVLESSGPDDTVAYLCDSGGSQLAYNDDGGAGRNFCLRHDLAGGRTYYYDVGYYYSDTGDIPVSLSKEVSVGGSSAEVATAGERARLRFTPASSGTYTIESSGSDDTYVHLLDAAGEEIACNDDDGGNLNFRLSHALEAGSTYYYEVRYFSSSATGTIPVTITGGVPPNPTTYRALTVGNNAYDSSPLSGCINDARAMGTMLRGLGNTYAVTVREDRTAAQVRSDIASAFAGADSNDVSLFYYSGHGVGSPDTDRVGALAGVHGDALTTAELASALASVPGKVVVILDSCFSGAAITDMRSTYDLERASQAVVDAFAARDPGLAAEGEAARAGELRQPKFYVLTASSAYEMSVESHDGGIASGMFTRNFLAGLGCSVPSGSYLGSMPADVDGNRQVTLWEAYDYSRSHVTSHSVQYYGTSSEVFFRR